MVQKKLMEIIFLFLVFQLIAGCKDKGTDPPPGKPFKHPREMTWTADTLEMPDYAIQLLPLDLLVKSPGDIWLAVWVGHGQVMHYDSTKGWQVVKEIGGGIDCLVEGEANSIWAGGYIGRDVNGQFTQNAYLGYYNGTGWQDAEFNIRSEILDLTKDAEGNIWACGRNGLVMKYENNHWIADTVNLNLSDDTSYWLKSIERFNGKTYVLVSASHKTTYLQKYYYLSGEMDNFVVLDSMVFDSPSTIIKWGYLQLYSSNFNRLYSVGLSGIWEYLNGSWEKIFGVNGTMINVYGVSGDYLLAVGNFNTALYYNGNKWESVSDLITGNDPSFHFWNVWTNGYEIIITGFTFIDGLQKTIIWHGK